MTNAVLSGKPDAGNPHVRFDEGEVSLAATPRRGSLLYNTKDVACADNRIKKLYMCFILPMVCASSVVFADDKPVVESIQGARDAYASSSLVDGSQWSGGLQPGAGTNYVWNGGTLRTPEYNSTPVGGLNFKGDRLTLKNGSFALKAGSSANAALRPIRIDDLVVDADRFFFAQSAAPNTLFVMDGCITLGAEASLTTVKDLFLVSSYDVAADNHCNYDMLFRCAFVSAQDGQCIHARQYNDQNETDDVHPYRAVIRIAGDNSLYTGSWQSHNISSYMHQQGVTLVMEGENAMGAVPSSLQADAVRLYNHGGFAVAPWLTQPYAPGNKGLVLDALDPSKELAVGRFVTVSNETWGLGMPVSGSGALVKSGAGKVRLQGSYAATGPITVESGTLALSDGFTTAAFPAVSVNEGALFEVESLSKDGLVLSNVTLPAGTIITAYADAEGTGPVSLDSTCSIVAWPLKARLSAIPEERTPYCDIVKVAKGLKSVTASDFDFSAQGSYGLPHYNVQIREEGDWQVVAVQRRSYVVVSDFAANDNSENHYVNDSRTWSPSAEMTLEKDYFVDRGVRNSLRTSAGSSSPLTFLGGSLTIYGQTVALKNPTFTVDNLVMAYNSGFNTANGNYSYHICGHMTVDSSCTDGGPAKMMGSFIQPISLESDVSGSGSLEFRPYDDGQTSKTIPTITNVSTAVISGNNGAFAGNLRVRSYYVEAGCTNEGQTLVFTHPEALGGPLGTFHHDAVYVGPGCALEPAVSMTLATENRGIAFAPGSSEPSRIIVPNGIDLTVRQVISLNGQLNKEGAGTLAIGAPTQVYYDGQVQLPTGLNNVLDVRDGWIKPLCAGAFTDLSVKFSASAGLRLDVDPSDADLKEYGLINTYTNTFLLAGASLPVRIDGVTAPNGNFSVAICTVTEDTAAALSGKLPLTNPCKDYWLSSILEDCVEINSRNYTRLTAKFGRRGMVMIFR